MKHIIILTIIIILSSCSTSGNRYGKNYNYNSSSKNLTVSTDKIDKYKTYEIYFTFPQKIECATLSISSKYISDRIDNKKKLIKTYFILERMIDIRNFNKNKSYSFTELERNFDLEWKRKHLIIICNKREDPIYKLQPGYLYRIRFTAFLNRETEFIISLTSPRKVTYFKTFDDYRLTLKKESKVQNQNKK